MSVEMMALVWRSSLPAEEKFVALALADHADPDGRNIYPSQSTISAMVGKTDRAVRRSLRKLEARGVLVVDPWPGDGRYRATVRYRLAPETLRPPDVTSGPQDAASDPPPDESSAPPPDVTSGPPDVSSATPGRPRPVPPDAHVRRSVRDPEEEEIDLISDPSSSFDPDPDAREIKTAMCPIHEGLGGKASKTTPGEFYHWMPDGKSRHDFVPAESLAAASADPYGHVYRRN